MGLHRNLVGPTDVSEPERRHHRRRGGLVPAHFYLSVPVPIGVVDHTYREPEDSLFDLPQNGKVGHTPDLVNLPP